MLCKNNIDRGSGARQTKHIKNNDDGLRICERGGVAELKTAGKPSVLKGSRRDAGYLQIARPIECPQR